MGISFINISDLKKKFARLLSLLFHNANLGLDNINEKMISSSFLDIFEENKLDDFMAMSNEDIIKKLFPNVIITDYEKQDIGEVYWAGIQYINIFLNYRIPLRSLFLLFPLKEMVSKFIVYHEMNEIELCKDFMINRYENVSILAYFRKRSGLSLRELSYLTNISKASLRYFEQSNWNLFNTTNKVANVLEETLGIPSSFLRKQSSFLPITYGLLNNDEFIVCLKEAIEEYLGKNINDLVIDFDETPIRKSGTTYLMLNGNPTFQIGKKEYHFNNLIMQRLLSIALDQYIGNNININLAF